MSLQGETEMCAGHGLGRPHPVETDDLFLRLKEKGTEENDARDRLTTGVGGVDMIKMERRGKGGRDRDQGHLCRGRI